jgi:hypothetical protein
MYRCMCERSACGKVNIRSKFVRQIILQEHAALEANVDNLSEIDTQLSFTHELLGARNNV